MKELSNESAPERPAGFENFLRVFNNFLNLSDEPGRFIRNEEKIEVLKSGDREALDRLMKEKGGSKYRKNAFGFLLGWANTLLDEPEFIKKISEGERENLRQEITDLGHKINELRIADAPITKSEVDRGVNLANKLKQIIQSQ